MNAKIRAMRVAVRRMMYAVSLLGLAACGGEAGSDVGTVEQASVGFTGLFCQSAYQCDPQSPLGKLASRELVTADTTLDGCLEIAEELQDAIDYQEPGASAEWAALLVTDPCEL